MTYVPNFSSIAVLVLHLYSANFFSTALLYSTRNFSMAPNPKRGVERLVESDLHTYKQDFYLKWSKDELGNRLQQYRSLSMNLSTNILRMNLMKRKENKTTFTSDL